MAYRIKQIIKKYIPVILLCSLLLVSCTSAPISTDESSVSESSEAESEQINESESSKAESESSKAESEQPTESETVTESEPEQSSMPEEYLEKINDGWTAPKGEDLVGTAWGWEKYTDDWYLVSNLVSFNSETVDVVWHDGIDEVAHVYAEAPYEITFENGVAVFEVDFSEMAGKLLYYILISPERDELYTLEVNGSAGGEPISAILSQKLTADPMELVGKWDRIKTMVEGDETESEPNTCIVEITGDSRENLKISYMDNAYFVQNSYSDKALIFSLGALPIYTDCGNDVWYADVDHVGKDDTTFAITLLADGTLLLQNYFTVDGAPMVSYEWFKRIS